jgi:hypothetical protein
MTRGLYSLAILCALAIVGCVDAVQYGQPPLVQGCTRDSDCPFAFLCNQGSCEEFLCGFYCDGGVDDVGGAPSIAGCPSPSSDFGCVVAPDLNLGSGYPFAYCARGATSTVCQCVQPDAGFDLDAGPDAPAFYCPTGP